MNQLYKHQQYMVDKYDYESVIPIFADAGTGKLVVKGTNVVTPTGLVPIEDIQIGDELCGYSGIGQVINKFHETEAELYDIEFSDHTVIRACKDHLWWVKDNQSTKKRQLNIWEVKSTQELLDKGLLYHGNSARWDIPLCEPTEFREQPIPVAPYTLGVIIGDGNTTTRGIITVTSDDKEVWDGIKADGYEIGHVANDGISKTIKGIGKSSLPKEVKGYSYEKHIPPEYLFNSIDVRIKLLQGLIDTDGYVDLINQRNGGINPQLRYATTSEQLFKDITFLVESLGGIVTSVDKREAQYEGNTYRMRWCFTIVLPRWIEKQCCTINHKLERILMKEPKQKLHRKIIKITYVGKGEGYCLTTDTPDHAYLLDHCIVTHNTLTALEIAMRKYNRGEIDCVLVIAPNGVHKQWACEEIPKWCKDVETTVQWRKNKKLFHVEGKLNFCCTNVEQFSTQTRYMDYVEWVNGHKALIILDEATRIKNPKAIRTQRLLYEFNNVVRRGRAIIKSEPKTVARIILTGTPITNGPFDVWSMFEFLQPGYFGLNYYAFQNKYGLFHGIQVNGRMIRILINEEAWQGIKMCQTFEQACAIHGVTLSTYDYIMNQDHYEGPFRNVEELRQQMCKTATFIRIEDCLDMPERSYTRRLIDMSPEQARVYKEMERYLLTEYKGEVVAAKTKLAALIRLQQIASGFVSSEQLPENEEEDPPPNKITWLDTTPKIDRLLIDLEEICGGEGVVTGNGESPARQCIIVCHFSAEADRLFNELTEKGYKCCLMTGWKKVGSIEGFKQNKYQVMVANIRVIAMGFNLQEHCHHMIFYSNSLSLEDRIQVEARIYRSGQTRTCVYIDYLMADTFDMKAYAMLKRKKDMSDYIRDKSVQELLEEIDDATRDEWEECVF